MAEPSRNPLLVMLARLGAAGLEPLCEMGRMGVFLLTTLLYVFVPPLKFRWVVKRVQFVGFQSLIVIALTGLFTGMVLGFQGFYTLFRVGSTAFLGPMVALSLLREMGPVITGLMVTARAGSAICAEIGIMRISEEIDALELMGLSPFRYLMVPVMLATLICMPLLTALFNVIGIAGGYLVSVRLLDVPASTYFGEMLDYVDFEDVTGTVYKSLAFAVLVAWISCYKGYHAGFGAEGVSKASTQAVVLSSVLILVGDYFMTSVLW